MLTQEARQLAEGVNNDTKHKLNSNKGVITNKLEELKQLDNEIMDLSMDEEEIANIMVSTEFEAEVQETLSAIEEVLTDKFRLFNIGKPIHIERLNQSHMSAGTSSRRKTVKLSLIYIPKFSGELLEWPTFFDSFKAAIDTSSDLHDIKKFTYLRSYL